MPNPITFYATGTASVANGATTITFSGALLGTAEFPTIQAGDLFFDPAQPAIPGQRIASVDYDAGTAELWADWPGTSMSSDAYEVRFTGDPVRSTAQTRKLLEELSTVQANGRGRFYVFDDSTTDSDPGTGKFRINAATFAASTGGYIDNLDANGATVSAVIDTWDDVGTSDGRGQLWVMSIATPSTFAALEITGSVVDGTGYRKLTWDYVGGSGSLAAGDEIMVMFSPKGDRGADGAAIVDTRTDLKAIDTSANTAAILKEAGRDGVFVFRAGDYASLVTADTEEAIYIEADDTASSSGAWVRQGRLGAVAVGWFGATGDGSTDDTAAIQAAIDAMPNSTDDVECGGTLLFHDGVYNISDELVLNKNIAVVGLGNATIAGNLASATHKTAFYVGDEGYLSDTADGYLRVSIQRLNFDLTNHDFAIKSDGVRTIRVERCAFHGGGASSVQVSGAWSSSWVRDCWFQGGGQQALRIFDNSNAIEVAGNRFAGYDDTSAGLAVNIRASQGVWVHHNDFEYCQAHLNAFGTATNTCNNLRIHENWFEGAVDYNIKIDNGTYGFDGVSIRGNSFYGATDGSVYAGVSGGAGSIRGLAICDNVFNSPSTLYLSSDASKYGAIEVRGNTPETLNGPAAFIATKGGTDQTGIASATYTQLTFGTEALDRRGRFASNAWTPPPGHVTLLASVSVSAGLSSGSYVIVAIFKNGSIFKRAAYVQTSSTEVPFQVAADDVANGTDVYTAWVYADGTGTKTVSGNADRTWFQGRVIS